MSVKIAQFLAVVIRKEGLARKSISAESIKENIETKIFDEDENLMSIGPCFGEEAVNRISEKLEKLGLEYVTDYFTFTAEFPEWAYFSVGLNHEKR